MRTRAAAALHKALTFQDVRDKVKDVSPTAVWSLVELLRQDNARAMRDGRPLSTELKGDTSKSAGARLPRLRASEQQQGGPKWRSSDKVKALSEGAS